LVANSAFEEALLVAPNLTGSDLNEALLKIIRSIEIDGATGHIKFDQNDRSGTYEYRLVQGDGGGSFRGVGVWDGAVLR
jgi:ABC-type branched-subunit amino acid transport system substrate-binding protein